MKIAKLIVGQLQTNCYLVWDDESREVVIVDPGDAADFIIRRIQDLDLNPKFIIATHGHVDHILAVTELQLAFDIPFLVHQKDLFLVKRVKAAAKYWFGMESDPPPIKIEFIKEGDLIKFGKVKLEVIETPGHSPGGVAFLAENTRKHLGGETKFKQRKHPRGETETKPVLFSGDTLFRQGVGRTNFSYSSKKDLIRSIKKLLRLPGNTKVFPGHGEETTLEKESEFYIK